MSLNRDDLAALDRSDPLASFHDRFLLPQGMIYLDGNSLGALPRATPERLRQVMEEEWGSNLITSWMDHDWIGMPVRVGEKIGRLLGARPGEVLVADSTSLNLFKLVAAALELQPKRRVVLTEEGNFPTDLYMMQGLQRLLGDRFTLRTVPRGEVETTLRQEGGEIAVVALSHISYRTGEILPPAPVNEAAASAGAAVVWDLAHSLGTQPLDLPGDGIQLAVGCGYKYLNGGPGAPAFLYVAGDLQPRLHSPLSGWLGHARPFDFSPQYQPAPGILRFLCGTPPILSMAALEVGVDLLLEADLATVRTKAKRLGELFLQLVEERLPDAGLRLGSPRDSERRGSQLCLRHGDGEELIQGLIERKVVGDFRAPDVLRFGFAPLYLRYADIWQAVDAMAKVLRRRG